MYGISIRPKECAQILPLVKSLGLDLSPYVFVPVRGDSQGATNQAQSTGTDCRSKESFV